MRRPIAVLAVSLVALAITCKSDGGTTTPVPTTVTIAPTAVTLSALGASQALTATVRDQNNNVMTGQGITWSSTNTAAVSVSTGGVVTAVANGVATVRAEVGAVQGSITVTVAQTVSALVKISGDAQSAAVGSALPTALVVRANDANANPVANVTVTLAVTQGGGNLTATSQVTATDGQIAGVTWTIGTVAGAAQQATASATGAPAATFTATANAGAAAAIVAVSGNNQTGFINQPLAAPIVARVNDQFGNAVSGHTVDFVVTGGGGSVSPPTAATGSNGQAQTAWTLGPSLGGQTLEARATGLAGTPLLFGVTATNLQITAIAPDTLVEGQSATITGTGFDATPANNTVRIGGTVATVTAAVTTSLTVTVPPFDCQPARDAGVTVSVGGGTSNTVTRRLHPPAFTTVAVGEQVMVEDPAQYCLQFRPSATGGDSYLVGVGAAAEVPSGVLPFSLTTVIGGAAATGVASRTPPTGPAPTAARLDLEVLARRAAHMRAERVLREGERELLARSGAGVGRISPQPAAAAPTAVPSVGDTIRMRVLNFSQPLCNNFTEILTRVRVVGAAGIWVTDTLNPPTDSLTTAEIQAYSDTFDTKIYATDTLYFGAPSDIDVNQRVFIVLTIQVNKIPLGAAGFVFSGDLFSRASCQASNGGEIFYSHVPDPANTAGTGARSKAGVLFQMPSLIAHEFAHNIQVARRIVLASGTTLSSWEAEGQASLAEEVVGHSVLGNTTGQNYGASVAFGADAGERWYFSGFVQLARYFGWDGSGTTSADTVPNAPALCTLFGSTAVATNCSPFAFYGASWAFLRYLSDRFGPAYPGGEAQLHRDLIGKTVGAQGVDNIQALLGRDVDSLFTQWGGMLYVDDRVPGAAGPVTMTSWNLTNVFNAFVSDAFRLDPAARSWVAFTDSRSVRGGSNAYTRLSSGGPRPALSLRVRDPGGGTLAGTLRPRLWIVRLQ